MPLQHVPWAIVIHKKLQKWNLRRVKLVKNIANFISSVCFIASVSSKLHWAPSLGLPESAFEAKWQGSGCFQWVGFQCGIFFHSLWRRGSLAKGQQGYNLQLDWQALNCTPTIYPLCHLVQVTQHPQVWFFIDKTGLVEPTPTRLRNIKPNNEGEGFCMLPASWQILQKC